MKKDQEFNFNKNRLNGGSQKTSHNLEFHPGVKSLKAFS